MIKRDPAGTWIEPFLGSGVVALNVAPRRALLADSNPHLIRFYQAVKDGAVDGPRARRFLQREGRLLVERGQDHYYSVRDRFNTTGDPLDFLFLNRSCFNGMIRFNKQGRFNVPFGHKPNRFAPAYITKIVNQIECFRMATFLFDWKFVCQDYRFTIREAREKDFVYCDPPYIGRHVDYYDSWDEESEESLQEELKIAGTRFMLSTWHSNEYRQNRYRGRDAGLPGAPRSDPYVRVNAYGSYLRWLTANRAVGHGCTMRGLGHSLLLSASIQSQEKRSFSDLRRRTRIQILRRRHTNCCR